MDSEYRLAVQQLVAAGLAHGAAVVEEGSIATTPLERASVRVYRLRSAQQEPATRSWIVERLAHGALVVRRGFAPVATVATVTDAVGLVLRSVLGEATARDVRQFASDFGARLAADGWRLGDDEVRAWVGVRRTGSNRSPRAWPAKLPKVTGV